MNCLQVTAGLRRWGWLAFNSGSTYGVTGERWKYAARAAVSTMMGSMGGGLVGLGFSLTNPNGIDILSQINGILGALVAITGTRNTDQYERNKNIYARNRIDRLRTDGVSKVFVTMCITLGGCFLYAAWEAMVIGMIGAFITCIAMPALDKIRIDDPVGAAATHGACSWCC